MSHEKDIGVYKGNSFFFLMDVKRFMIPTYHVPLDHTQKYKFPSCLHNIHQGVGRGKQ